MSILNSYFYSFWREFLSFFPEQIIFIKRTIPYFSQFASADLAEKIVTGKMQAKDDPNWKESGAHTAQEYALWSRNMCGMACLKMILAYLGTSEVRLVQLAKACMQYGGYVITGEKIDGLFYEPFCRYVKKRWALSAMIAPVLTMRRIRYEIGLGNFVIVSVHPGIRNQQKKKDEKNGGHLVLLTGFDLQKHTLYLHNPSGFTKLSQEHFEISEVDFLRFFAGRGIVICKHSL